MFPVNMDVISWLGAFHVKNEVSREAVCRCSQPELAPVFEGVSDGRQSVARSLPQLRGVMRLRFLVKSGIPAYKCSRKAPSSIKKRVAYVACCNKKVRIHASAGLREGGALL